MARRRGRRARRKRKCTTCGKRGSGAFCGSCGEAFGAAAGSEAGAQSVADARAAAALAHARDEMAKAEQREADQAKSARTESRSEPNVWEMDSGEEDDTSEERSSPEPSKAGAGKGGRSAKPESTSRRPRKRDAVEALDGADATRPSEPELDPVALPITSLVTPQRVGIAIGGLLLIALGVFLGSGGEETEETVEPPADPISDVAEVEEVAPEEVAPEAEANDEAEVQVGLPEVAPSVTPEPAARPRRETPGPSTRPRRRHASAGRRGQEPTPTSAPTPTPAPSAGDPATYMANARRHVSAQYRSAIQSCFNQPGASGRIVLGLVPHSDGRVASSRIVEDTTQTPAIGACLTRTSRTWHLPEPPSRTLTVRLSFRL